MEKMVDRV